MLRLPRAENWGFHVEGIIYWLIKTFCVRKISKVSANLVLLDDQRSGKSLAEWAKIPYNQLNIVGTTPDFLNILPLLISKVVVLAIEGADF